MTIINVPNHVMEQDTQKNSNRISGFIQVVEDNEMHSGTKLVKYTGELLNGQMFRKGIVRCLDNTQKETYYGEIYNGKKHGKGTVLKK